MNEGGERRKRKRTAKIRILLEDTKGQIMFNNLSHFMRYKYDDSHVMTSFALELKECLVI